MIRSRVVAVPLAVLALGGVGAAAFGSVGDDSVHYRTVAATIGDVEQTLTLTGVIEPSGRTDLSFGASGTVGKVRVAQGDEVEEGDVVAVLDRAALRAEVEHATADLADARAQLVEDRAAQSSVVASAAASSSTSSSSASTSTRGSGSSSGTGASGSGGGSGSAGGSTAAVLAQLSEQQDAVLTAQTAATTALEAASAALATQQTACADPAATAADAGAVDGTEDAGTETSAVLSEDCTTALTAVQTAQSAASEAQTALQTALEALGGTLGKALATLSTPTSGTGGTATPSTGGTGSGTGAATPSTGTSSGSGSAASSMTRTVTAATLASDQAAIDSARAALLAARAALAGAVVRAPADATVVSLPVEQGSAVSAGDTVAIVVAPGLTTVSVDVSRTQAEQLEVGLAVAVTPAGAGEALSGSISRINHTATDSTSGSDPTYGVEVVLDDRDLAIPDGMPATVSIVVGSAANVVTVPASAVTDGAVTVLDGSATKTVRVTTGIVGSTRIEITDGIDEGDEVVLADLDAEVATGESTQTGPGGVGGGITGGFGGGGFSGGPPTGRVMTR